MVNQLPARLTCHRCGHQWTPRVVITKLCPKCKSVKWNIPKKNTTVEHSKKETHGKTKSNG